jgi:ribosome modulation factor
MKEPNGFSLWNPAMRGAYRKGYAAGESGFSVLTCPYQDKRKKDGRLTWSRAFESAWVDGWRDGVEAMKSAAITAYYSEKQGHGQPQGMPR